MSPAGAGARILLVEDTAFSLQLMTYLLTANQHTVVEAVTGEQAIVLASAAPPDLVVLDLQLPGIDGFETLTALRSLAGGRATPMIAVTSFAMVGDRDRAIAAGFDHYMTKPIDPESFAAEINGWLPEQLRGHNRPQPGAALAAAPGPEPAKCDGADIVVVDDSLINLTLLRSILEPNGYHVRTASTVEEAITAVEATCPDLVLSDFHIGARSGSELLAHLRAAPLPTSVPFAFLSATTDGQDPIMQQADAVFIRRPIEPAALLVEVETLLQARKGA